jgi:phage anti-repressor protein
MQELIAISESTIGSEVVQTVSARELWVYLESKADFSTWIKKRIDQFDFTQGIDFTVPLKNGTPKSMTYGNTTIEYFLSIEMAKELSMVEQTAKGKEARKYFIECERRAKQISSPKELSRKDLALMVIDAENEIERLTLINDAQKPAVAFVEKYVEAENLMGFRQVAKLLQVKEPTFRDFLIDNKIMYKLNCEWVSYAHHLDAGRFRASTGIADNEHAYTSHKFTTKGVEWIAGLIASKKVSNTTKEQK